MTSRSVRRRLTRRRTAERQSAAPARRSALLLEVETPTATRQSFLIMSDDSLRIDLSGYEQNDKGGLRMVVVPVTITARIIDGPKDPWVQVA
jgi:hypothetical protein